MYSGLIFELAKLIWMAAWRYVAFKVAMKLGVTHLLDLKIPPNFNYFQVARSQHQRPENKNPSLRNDSVLLLEGNDQFRSLRHDGMWTN